jgi:cell division septum initiation protein DivIVA
MDETASPLEYTKCLLDMLKAKKQFLAKFKRTFDEETGKNTASLIPNDINFPTKLKILLEQIIFHHELTKSTEKILHPLMVEMEATAKQYKGIIEEIIAKNNKADTILKETTSPLEFAKNVRMWFSARQELKEKIGRPYTPDIATEKAAKKIIDAKFTHIPEFMVGYHPLKFLIYEIIEDGLTQATSKGLDRMISEMEKKEQEVEQKNAYNKRTKINELLEPALGPDTLKMLEAPHDDMDHNFNEAANYLNDIIIKWKDQYEKESTPENAIPSFTLMLRLKDAIREWKTVVASAISEYLDEHAELSEEEKKTIRVDNKTAPFNILLIFRHLDDQSFREELTKRKAGLEPSRSLNFYPLHQMKGSART